MQFLSTVGSGLWVWLDAITYPRSASNFGARALATEKPIVPSSRCMMPVQIRITADDFGWTRAQNQAVEQACAAGTLTHASLLTNGFAVDDAVAVAKRVPQLGVGVHLTLCEGAPLSDPAALAGLTSADGHFHDGLSPLLSLYLRRSLPLSAIETEWQTQIDRALSLGFSLTHIDGHKHVHVLPPLIEIACRLAQRYRIPFVRSPYESPSSRIIRRLPGWLVLSSLALSARQVILRHGLRTADHFVGFSVSGGMTEAYLLAAIAAAPSGLTEIMVHPAEESEDLAPLRARYDWAHSYRFGGELAALCSPQVRAALLRRAA